MKNSIENIREFREVGFRLFEEAIGRPTHRTKVPQETIESYRNRLPDYLLDYWEVEGWCQYQDGMFWTVNPADYAEIVHAWLSGTPYEKLDTFHVYARTAFGELFLCGEKIGATASIRCLRNDISSRSIKIRDSYGRNVSMSVFFSSLTLEELEMFDDSENPLFDKAKAKLGTLRSTEMYAFEPALVAGGRASVESVVKVRMDVHVLLLRELGGTPNVPYMDLSRFTG